MTTKVFFLYKGVKDQLKLLSKKNIDGVYSLSESLVIALDTEKFKLQEKLNIEREFYLREFEIEQEKFFNVIKQIPILKVRLLNIEINKSYEDPELHAELDECILRQDIPALIRIIEEYKFIGKDINSIEIYVNDGTVRMTRLAELDILKDDENISEVLNSSLIKYLIGLTREVEFN